MPPRERVVDAALKSLRLPAKLATGSRTLLNGLWLGVLSDADLALIDERYYEAAGQYRTAAWNEQGLFQWEQQMVDKHFTERGRVVVTSAGGGREVLALLQQGFDAHGFEPHPDLVAYAEQLLAAHGHPGRVQRSARDGFPDSGRCDGVIVGWGAYSLLHGRSTRVAFLAEARAALSIGAPVLLSHYERVADDRELRWTHAISSRLRALRGAPPTELGDTFAPNLAHVFTRAELAEELRASGFEPVASLTVGQADQTTQYGCAVARAT